MRKLVLCAVVLVALLSAGCNLQVLPGATPESVGTNTNTLVPTTVNSPMPPTAVIPTVQPASGEPSSDDSEQAALGTSIAATKGPLRVKIYMVAIGDNGKSGKLVGCGDSLVEVSRDIPRTRSPLTDALTLLFSLKDQYYGQSGLYNSLHASNLKMEGISAHEGVFRVNLVGTISLAGECDDPRFAEQIKATILQFSTVKDVQVFINGTPMEKLLGGAGR